MPGGLRRRKFAVNRAAAVLYAAERARGWVGATGSVVDDAGRNCSPAPAGGLDCPKTGTVPVTVTVLDFARRTTPTTRPGATSTQSMCVNKTFTPEAGADLRQPPRPHVSELRFSISTKAAVREHPR